MKITTFESGSTGNLHLLEYDKGKILLECGLPIRKIISYLNHNLAIDACLLSHYHMDHAKSSTEIMRAGIDLYCSGETADFLKLKSHRLHNIDQSFKIGEVSVFPFRTNHDTVGSLGFLISQGSNRVLFATDTATLPYKFPGMTHIMIECNWSESTIKTNNEFVLNRTKKTHMSLDSCIDFLKVNDLSKVREIRLIHLSDSNSDPDYFKSEVQKITGKLTIIS